MSFETSETPNVSEEKEDPKGKVFDQYIKMNERRSQTIEHIVEAMTDEDARSLAEAMAKVNALMDIGEEAAKKEREANWKGFAR